MNTVKFRHSAAIAVAGLIALFGAVPVATVRWYLAPILLVPIAVMIWGWRAGTDANRDGLSIRALFGARRLTWAQITGFVPADRRVIATLSGGGTVTLPAVGPADLPKLVAASGQDLGRPEPAGTGPAGTEPDATGPDATGPDTTGPDQAGPGQAGPDETELAEAGLVDAERDQSPVAGDR